MTAAENNAGAAEIAALILSSFRAYRERFREITLAAKTRFERAAWIEGQVASAQRIEIYKEFVGHLQAEIGLRLRGLLFTPALSRAVKGEYVRLIATQPDGTPRILPCRSCRHCSSALKATAPDRPASPACFIKAWR